MKPINECKAFPLSREAVAAFEDLKNCIEASVVTAVDENLPFDVETDASQGFPQKKKVERQNLTTPQNHTRFCRPRPKPNPPVIKKIVHTLILLFFSLDQVFILCSKSNFGRGSPSIEMRIQ